MVAARFACFASYSRNGYSALWPLERYDDPILAQAQITLDANLSPGRFVVLQILLLWQGGFLFYTAVVVLTTARPFSVRPRHKGPYGPRHQDVLNRMGIAAPRSSRRSSGLRDPIAQRRAPRGRWWCWWISSCRRPFCFTAIASWMRLMDPDQTRVVIHPPFYLVHRVYLSTSTAKWLIGLVLSGLTLLAWRAEDQ